MKGTPDEDYDGFLNTPYFDGATGNNPANAPSSKPFVKAYNRQLDIEQDLFTFNFNGRSGHGNYPVDYNRIRKEEAVRRYERVPRRDP